MAFENFEQKQEHVEGVYLFMCYVQVTSAPEHGRKRNLKKHT
jgi:hypothetical protein